MKTTTKRCLSVCLIAFAMICFSFAGFAQNLVTNPGFETWTGGKPDGWVGSKTNIVAANVVQYSTSVHGGSFACQLINSESSHKRFTSVSLTVVAGQTYTINFWARGHADVRSGMWDGVATGGENYIYNDYINVNSTDWAQYTQTVTAPASVTNAELIFSLRNTNADKDHLQLDDVEFLGGGTVPLTADFDATPKVGAPGTVVQFTDKSMGNPIAWQWTISGADNFSSTLQNPSFTFTKTGSYNVKLIVSDENTSDEKEVAGFININNFIFYQDWNDKNMKGWTKKNISGEQEWDFTDQYGIDNTPCMRMSGHNGTTSVANEDWLISPTFSLSAGNQAKINFENAVSSHAGHVLELYISTNYDGNNVTAANWTKLSFTLSPSGQYYVWTNSGDISLSSFFGENCYIGFKYISTNDASSVWELDNISLSNDAVSVPEIASKQECKIYPNPSNGIFSVKTQGAAKVQVYSIDGRMIKEQTMNKNTEINLVGHSQGIYFVRITNENGTISTRKIIVQ